MRIIFFILWLVTAGPLFAQIPNVGDKGSLQGQVLLSDTRQPLAGATVTALPEKLFGAPGVETPATTASRTRQSTAVTDGKGGFSLSGLTPGRYMICATVQGSDLLQPCEWGRGRDVVIAPLRTTRTVVNVERGQPVAVRVADPGAVLDTNEKANVKVHLLVGAWQGNRFHPARITASDKTARIYSVVVPFDVPVELAVRGENVNAQDSSGKAVGKQDRIVINQRKSNGKVDKTFDYAITGATPQGAGGQK